MNSIPFTHYQIPNPSGLFALIDIKSNRTLSYNCQYCSQYYSTSNDAVAAKRNFVRHAKSDRHRSMLLSLSILPDVDAISQINCNNSHTEDDSLKEDLLSTFSQNHDSDVSSILKNDDDPISSDRSKSLLIQDTLKDLFGINTSNFLYFLHESIKEKSGFKALMSSCLLNNTTLYSFVKDYDVALHYNLLKVLSSLSQKQRHSLADVFSTVVINHEATNNAIVNPSVPDDFTLPFINIDIPVSYQDFRRSYTHGPNSLWVHLPHPEIFSVSSRNKYSHCYTKVKDCIAHFLAVSHDFTGCNITTSAPTTAVSAAAGTAASCGCPPPFPASAAVSGLRIRPAALSRKGSAS